MNDISIYFKPSENSLTLEEETLGKKIIFHTEGDFPEIEKKSIALIFCPETRASQFVLEKQTNTFLQKFCALNVGDNWNFKLYDLGIIEPGNEINDTYFALNHVVQYLLKLEVLPIIIGGSQDLTFPIYQAFQKLEQMVNLTCIDYAFDLGDPENQINDSGYISQILMHRPCYLFNVSTLGVQSPYLKRTELDLFEKLYFDICRLGELNADYKIAEPILRNTDILSLDMRAIRRSDYPILNANPNGFYAEQICQLAKYAGISDKLSVYGVFNFDSTEINDSLLAEIIWYFLDGVAQRKGDFPIGTKKDYIRFTVHMEEYESDLVFYKSPKSDRWWLEVPYPPQKGFNYERHHLVPCTYDDYQAAMKNELPNLWWKTYQKLV